MAKMTYRPLGRCGTKVSAFGLGGWTTYGGSVRDQKMVSQIIHRAFEKGINFFDIADVYERGESEKAMGQVLKELPRRHLIISSKTFWPMSDDINDRGLSRKHIMESVESSLKRIGTDYLDLYFCHRYDPDTPLEETVRAMDDLVKQGKILYWCTSEWTGEQLKDAQKLAKNHGYYRPQVEQPQYSLLYKERFETEIQPVTSEFGMGVVVWSPLASGMLTGKYDKGIPEGSRLSRIDWIKDIFFTPANQEKVKALKAISDELGCSRTQLALAWTSAQRGVSSVILGASNVQQLDENLGALEIQMTPEVDKAIRKIFQ